MAIPLDYYNIFGKAPEGKVLNKPLADANYYFGIPDFVKLSDANKYFMDAPIEDSVEDPSLPPVSGIYNPNLLPLNFNNDNDRDNMIIDRPSPDLELENMYEDEDRFNDTVQKKGIMEILGMLPTPFNLARKGIEFFNDYRENKKKEIEAAKILEQMRQERIKNEQIAKEKKEQAQRDAVERMRQRNEREGRGGYQSNFAQDRDFMEGPQGDGDGGGGGGGSPGSSGPGGSDSMGSFAYGGQVRRNYLNGGIVSLRGKI